MAKLNNVTVHDIRRAINFKTVMSIELDENQHKLPRYWPV
jgi:hypothetical protein